MGNEKKDDKPKKDKPAKKTEPVIDPNRAKPPKKRGGYPNTYM